MNQPWHAPVATRPVRATVPVPGSKSITNRALVLAALSGTGGTVTGALRSRDTDLMVGALGALGVDMEFTADGTTVRVGGWPDGPGAASSATAAAELAVDCGLAGTVMRFVPPVAVLADGKVRFDGDPRARERPMGTVLTALRALGASVDGDTLPFTVHGTTGLPGGTVTIDASASSQFVSGLLLAGARYDRGVTVVHAGAPMPSMPHVEMTVRMLRQADVAVDDTEPNTWRVEPGPITGRTWRVEPDLSNATPFLAAAAVTGGDVTVPCWPTTTTQPGGAIGDIMLRLGCAVSRAPEGLTVSGPDRLAGIDVDLRDVGELTPTVAALAALADGPSVLRGIAHLRGHETDRLAALVAEINGLGGAARETEDGLAIEPAPLAGGTWHAYGDHRMATAGAIIGLVTPDVLVDDIGTTAKTLPGFPEMWAGMLDTPNTARGGEGRTR